MRINGLGIRLAIRSDRLGQSIVHHVRAADASQKADLRSFDIDGNVYSCAVFMGSLAILAGTGGFWISLFVRCSSDNRETVNRLPHCEVGIHCALVVADL